MEKDINRLISFMKIVSMNIIFSLMFGNLFACKEIKSKPDNSKSTQSFYDFKMKSLDGKEIDFKQYKGKKVLIVNTASKCGYTPQYAELEELHKKYGDKLVILGFPANNFMKQEPGSNEEIGEFCSRNYGVTFQMFEKVDVVGKDKAPLYKWLSDKSLNGWNNEEPSWNFCKYLISENGELLNFFNAKVTPLSAEMMKALELL
jgi:glutathione peroxidase